MPWKPQKGWMLPKTNNCVNCKSEVNPYGPGYLVWDSDTQEFWRQHVECKAEEDRQREERLSFPPYPTSGSKQAA